MKNGDGAFNLNPCLSELASLQRGDAPECRPTRRGGVRVGGGGSLTDTCHVNIQRILDLNPSVAVIVMVSQEVSIPSLCVEVLTHILCYVMLCYAAFL